MKLENFQQGAVRSSVKTISYENEEAESAPPTAEAIQDWLTARFSKLLAIGANDIDVHESLSSYGLGSIQAVSLTGDLEDWLGLQLPATLLWDYASIDALARHLAEELSVA